MLVYLKGYDKGTLAMAPYPRENYQGADKTTQLTVLTEQSCNAIAQIQAVKYKCVCVCFPFVFVQKKLSKASILGRHSRDLLLHQVYTQDNCRTQSDPCSNWSSARGEQRGHLTACNANNDCGT